MKKAERHIARENKAEVARSLKRLKDEYSFRQFQTMAYRLTGYVVKPYSDKCVLTIHRGICIKETDRPLVNDKFEWGVCGAYIKKPVETIKYKGNFTFALLKKIVNTAKSIKGDT